MVLYPIDQRTNEPKTLEKFKKVVPFEAKTTRAEYKHTVVSKVSIVEGSDFAKEKDTDPRESDKERRLVAELGNRFIGKKHSDIDSSKFQVRTHPSKALLATTSFEKDDLIICPQASYKVVDEDSTSNWMFAKVDGELRFKPNLQNNLTSIIPSTAEKPKANMTINYDQVDVKVGTQKYSVEVPFLPNHKAIKRGHELVVYDASKKSRVK